MSGPDSAPVVGTIGPTDIACMARIARQRMAQAQIDALIAALAAVSGRTYATAHVTAEAIEIARSMGAVVSVQDGAGIEADVAEIRRDGATVRLIGPVRGVEANLTALPER